MTYLYIMKRFILEIDDSEKNRILSIHNEARTTLFEQQAVTQTGGTLYSNQVMVPTEEDARSLSSDSLIRRATGKVKSTNIDKQTDFNAQLVSSYGDTYKSFINALGNSSNRVENAKIWYLQLTQDSRIAFLNQWKAYLETASRKIQKGKQEVKINLIKGKRKTTELELPANVTTPPPPIVILKEFNEVGKGKNVYNDNKSDVTPYMQGEIQNIINGAQEILNQAKEASATVVCTKMEVTASSSRLRNTGEAENITWVELSKKRAENVKNSLVSGLEGIGIAVPTTIPVLKGGWNGDGTSGPNPPKKDSSGNTYTITTDGTKNTIQKDETLRNSKKEPHTNIDDYLQYKFCIINVELQVKWGTLPDDVKKFETIISKDYTMEILPMVKVNTVSVKLPKNGFLSKLLPVGDGNTKKRNDICPAFGG